MNKNGKNRFKLELEKFVFTRLRPDLNLLNRYYYLENDDHFFNVKNRFEFMDRIWSDYNYEKNGEKIVNFPQLSNHEICHEMFWNAFRGRSRMYIQIQDLSSCASEFSNIQNKGENITLKCSLLTLQMLDYDFMMFRAMNDKDEEYREAALKHYRPYLFDYVVELNKNTYGELQRLQEKHIESNKKNERSPYLWMECAFDPDKNCTHVALDGYVVQSASDVTKIKTELSIIDSENVPIEMIKEYLDNYTISKYLKDDEFIKLIKNNLGNNCLSSVDVYKIGNGNCVFAQEKHSDISFFYDIGFNYRHTPKKINKPGVTYSYCETMREIYAKKPSFVILSHWDMDHIAGSFAAKDELFEKDWFAPDCYDACISAKRLAKYLDSKKHLFLAQRCDTGRQIGCLHLPSATYKLYMGQKDSCDRSSKNCEGIVIEYTDTSKDKTLLMMGDVNYASFNAAHNHSFADTKIDYLIVPHHGSQHTAYNHITDSKKIVKRGEMAVICCTDDPAINRPNSAHRAELDKRFKRVYTTEKDSKSSNSITISF